jgi:hypothetical protein
MSGRHRLGFDHEVPPWGLELYRNQHALAARMDEIMADATEVRANVQAFISEVTARIDALTNQPAPTTDNSAEVARLQEQLDAIDADIRAARDQMDGLSTGGDHEAPGAPVTDVPPAADSPVDTPVIPGSDSPTTEVPVSDPNAPSVAPGFE